MNLVEIGHLLVEFLLIIMLIRLSLLFLQQGMLVEQRHKLFYSIACFLYGLVITLEVTLRVSDFINPVYIVTIKGWINVTALVVTLSALGLMIRESKPKIARAPMILALIPFLILSVYPFVADTFILKSFLFMLLEGGGILIALLMYANHFSRNTDYGIIIVLIIIISMIIGLNLLSDQWVIISELLAVLAAYGIHKTYKIKQLQF